MSPEARMKAIARVHLERVRGINSSQEHLLEHTRCANLSVHPTAPHLPNHFLMTRFTFILLYTCTFEGVSQSDFL